jgi:hypothetical protein
LGNGGRWCWFTAAPIKAADGTVVGAIETLLDTTAAKQAEEEQRRRNLELTTLCSIYTALNAPLTLQKRIEGAVLEIRDFMKAESVCLYMAEAGGRFDLRYFNTCYADPGYGQAGPDSESEIMRKVSRTDKPVIYNAGDHQGNFSGRGNGRGHLCLYSHQRQGNQGTWRHAHRKGDRTVFGGGAAPAGPDG